MSPRRCFAEHLRGLWLWAGLALVPLALGAQSGTPCDTKTSLAATFSASCSSLACTFSLTTPAPPAGSDLEWDFGDGTF